MNAERIAELRELSEKATAGPWKFQYSPLDKVNVIYAESYIGLIRDKDDAAFIAAARTALPESLDEVERLTAKIEKIRFEIAGAQFCDNSYRAAIDEKNMLLEVCDG